jgi:hypothetical protein
MVEGFTRFDTLSLLYHSFGIMLKLSFASRETVLSFYQTLSFYLSELPILFCHGMITCHDLSFHHSHF